MTQRFFKRPTLRHPTKRPFSKPLQTHWLSLLVFFIFALVIFSILLSQRNSSSNQPKEPTVAILEADMAETAAPSQTQPRRIERWIPSSREELQKVIDEPATLQYIQEKRAELLSDFRERGELRRQTIHNAADPRIRKAMQERFAEMEALIAKLETVDPNDQVALFRAIQ